MRYTLLEEKIPAKKPLPDALQSVLIGYLDDGKPVPASEVETFHCHQPVKLAYDEHRNVVSMDCVSPCDDESRDHDNPNINIVRASSCSAVCDPFNGKACCWSVICCAVAFVPLGLLDLSYLVYSCGESVKLRYRRRQENRVASDFFDLNPAVLSRNVEISNRMSTAPQLQSMV